MDTILFAAWQSKETPFDGQIITVKRAVPLETLTNILSEIVEKLHETFGAESLHFLMDWHEHDGVVLPSKPTTWDVLQSEVASANHISRLFWNGDTYVRHGFYSESRRFYLRFYANEEDDWKQPPSNGDFDLTVAEDLANIIVPDLNKLLGENLRITSANAFFAEGYAG